MNARRLELVPHVRISFVALLVAAGAYLWLFVDFMHVVAADPAASFTNVIPHVIAGCCLAPFAAFLIRLHARSRR